MGGFDTRFSDLVEPPVRYHPASAVNLTYSRDPGEGHSKAGSLTGAVASQIVTEASKVALRLVGNQPLSI